MTTSFWKRILWRASVTFCVTLLLSPILLLVLVLLHWIVIWPIRYEFGWNGQGASHKTQIALQEGNAQEAIYWAEKTLAYRIIGVPKSDRSHWLFRIAQAYELDGQHEIAEHYYALSKLLKHEDIPPPK